jgi:hypothetical protein
VHDPTDKALFYCSTYIHIGNATNTPFWKAKWLYGAAPEDIEPGLFRMTRYKGRTVHYEMQNQN